MKIQRSLSLIQRQLTRRSAVLLLVILVATGACGVTTQEAPARTTNVQTQIASDDTPVRFASFNASLNRNTEGQLITDLSTPDDAQAQAVAEIIQRVNPDVLLINEFDYDGDGLTAQLFQDNYLSVSQNGVDPIEFPYVYLAPSNTGIASGEDLDNSGSVVTTPGEDGYGNDAFGFGAFPGQFGMVLYAKYPIVTEDVRTFQTFLWKDMPDALLPDDPDTPEPADFYTPDELDIFRLSSKSHWDVPIDVNGTIIHALVSHPTPPVFDGPEDRNGTRNHDEIRFWADYITPGQGSYIYDDDGETGGLPAGASFVIMGDQNADPFDGDSTDDAILQLLDNPYINTSNPPASAGAVEQAAAQGGANDDHLGDPAFDTADFFDVTPGNLRVDYVLPSIDLKITDSAVFWPESSDPLFDLVGTFPFPSSDHRLVWVDVVQMAPSDANRQTVTDVELLGEVTFDTGFTFEETEVGGLSGIAYDAANNIYYALSDDRSQNAPARFYTLAIDLDDGALQDGDITFQAVTTLLNAESDPFPEAGIDPEGIALTANGSLYISSEGDAAAEPPINPFVNEFSLDGQQLRELPVPAKFLPNDDSGIRNNLAFESLTLSPDERFLYTATENALAQDGPTASLEDGSLSRVVKYDLQKDQAVGEFVYVTDPVAAAPVPADAFSTNGLVELLAIDNNGTLLALERSFSTGVGNTVKLYKARTQGALDVSSQEDLFWEDGSVPFEIDPPIAKELLVDFADLGVTPDNLEALALGPQLPDGRQTLIVVSDNNFNDTQVTQFIVLALDLTTTPAALPNLETPGFLDDEENDLAGDSDDPAIWVHPNDPAQSLVIATVKDGGLVVFDLDGQIVQQVEPDEYGGERYNNVDLVYDFALGGESVDLAVVSDRENDTLKIFRIDPATNELSDVTAPDIIASIFGIDDGEQTAYGLATYTSLVSGQAYVFVCQRDGNLVAQLELTANGAGQVTATPVRTLELPVPTGDPTDSQAEGMVVDRETGILYVAIEEEVGVLKFFAEPSAGDAYRIIQPLERDYLLPDIEGLTIYYGPNGTGYLLVSSQGDSTYAVFERAGNNQYLGSFVVGDNGAIDQANETDGADVINVPLGPAYPSGLMVVQDGANDPQNAVEDDEELENNSTNFKFVPWESVANAFPAPLLTDTTSFDPRNPQPYSLVSGVASGDTTQNASVLWTRSTLPGAVTFEYAENANFTTILGTETAEVTNPLVPVKVDLNNLVANTTYYYRATDAAGATAFGRFQTAADPGTRTGLRFGVVGDWQQAPPFPSLANADERDLAFFLKHGDTIYADLETPGLPGTSQARTLVDFRTKHAENVLSRFGLNTLEDLYATTSIFATIDDHEVVDNFAGGAAPGESPDAPDIGSSPDPLFTDDVTYVNDTQAYEDALQAFQEYHPIQNERYGDTGDDRTSGERRLYRARTYGSDAALFVLDTRSFRDVQLPPADLSDPTQFLVNAFDPGRTILGRQQMEDLKADLLQAHNAGVTWKFIAVPEPIQNFGPVTAEDRFEGYAAERTELLSFIADNDIANVVFFAADFHGTIVNNLTYQLGPGQEQMSTGAFEVVTGPVAFFTGRFGPNVISLAAAGGLITPEQQAAYNALPIAIDSDDEVNDKDDFVKQLLNQQVALFGYDPIGLQESEIDATLLQGDYLAAHTFGWTEVEIDQTTQALTVTVYGIEAYSEAQLVADPAAIVEQTPQIISQFRVTPSGVGGAPSLERYLPIVGN